MTLMTQRFGFFDYITALEKECLTKFDNLASKLISPKISPVLIRFPRDDTYTSQQQLQ